MATDSHFFPPLQADEYSAADPARRRLVPKSGLRIFASLTSLRQRSKSATSRKSAGANDSTQATDERDPLRPSTGTDTIINLDGSAISDFHENKDVYRWAILYENQRGFTIFSTPYYSGLSLLPHDPLPFTVPCTSPKRSEQPQVSLAEYPLPDGTWRWVSKSWMIDMRSDSGEVQYDGFEYNWRFRQDKWSANVGKLSSGGWVRRRRWVRLMMRPARTVEEKYRVEGDSWKSPRTGESINSSVVPASEITNDAADLDAQNVWKSDGVEQDWARCHMLMKRLGRDGRKLELWKRWLGGYYSEHAHLGHLIGKGKKMQKQRMEDNGPLPSEAAWANKTATVITEGASPVLEHVAAVLRVHGDTLLRSFVYPDSRAQFLELLGRSGLLPEMNVGLGIGWSTTEIDFWSYASRLDQKLQEEDAKLGARKKTEKGKAKQPDPPRSGDNDVD